MDLQYPDKQGQQRQQAHAEGQQMTDNSALVIDNMQQLYWLLLKAVELLVGWHRMQTKRHNWWPIMQIYLALIRYYYLVLLTEVAIKAVKWTQCDPLRNGHNREQQRTAKCGESRPKQCQSGNYLSAIGISRADKGFGVMANIYTVVVWSQTDNNMVESNRKRV